MFLNLRMPDESISLNQRVETVDHFTSLLVNSGYDLSLSKEIIISGIIGVKRKLERRKLKGKQYRSGKISLLERIRKNLP